MAYPGDNALRLLPDCPISIYFFSPVPKAIVLKPGRVLHFPLKYAAQQPYLARHLAGQPDSFAGADWMASVTRRHSLGCRQPHGPLPAPGALFPSVFDSEVMQ